jgi:hypothetical protein
MRTTLTLDDDVAAALEQLRRKRDASLRDLVNEALREGLKQMTGRPAPRAPLRTRSVSLGACRIGNVDNVADALAIAEGESFR